MDQSAAKVGDNAPPAADPAADAKAKLDDLHARTCAIEQHLGLKREPVDHRKARKRH